MSNIEKAVAYFKAISTRNAALATEYMNPALYVEHNPHVRGDVRGVRDYIDQIALDGPYLKVVRAFADGAYVVTQSDGHIGGHCTFFDVFRFDDGLIVEHWSFSAEAGPRNKSGHTQLDGPADARSDVDTEKTRALVREYYEIVHIGRRHDIIPRYVSENTIRHEPGVADGLHAFMADLEVLTKDRTIDEIVLLLAQGDFVFLAVKGKHQEKPCVYIDLYRVEDGKLAEHWGFSGTSADCERTGQRKRHAVTAPAARMNAWREHGDRLG